MLQERSRLYRSKAIRLICAKADVKRIITMCCDEDTVVLLTMVLLQAKQ
jgi:hypothetical protein